MRNFLRSPLGPHSLPALFACNIAGCLLIFLLLEIWRPCYFLTDDNFSAMFPVFTEIGRHLQHGESPFITRYLLGGNFDMTRDISAVWHPFYILPTLLADTPARFWILDVAALLFFLLTVAGFSLLAHTLVLEFNPGLQGGYVVFYTLSFTFSSYILWIGSSWLNFLGDQSALPWLALGILQRRVLHGVLLVALFIFHEIFGGHAAMNLSNAICLTLFAGGVALCRRSPTPLASWVLGNVVAVLVVAPFLLRVIDGFAHSTRVRGITVDMASAHAIAPLLFPLSLLSGTWTGLISRWGNFPLAAEFPCVPFLLACAAAWCIVPALLSRAPWRGFEVVCLALMLFLFLLISRPALVAEIMHRTPFFKSMRWPFREGMQFLFFLHLLLLTRPWGSWTRWRPLLSAFSLAIFVAPMPFGDAPTLNPLRLDREILFSGKGEIFWDRVKTRLKPSDETATIIDWDFVYGQSNSAFRQRVLIAYSLAGTANFPAYFQVKCISGYAPTAPADQIPLKTVPAFWFGAFSPDQMKDILAEKPDLKLIRIVSLEPLKITLLTPGAPDVDLTPYIPK